MADKLIAAIYGEASKRLKDMNDGTHAEVVSAVTSNIVGKFREAFESYTPGVRWSEVKASGDIITVDGNAVGASYLVISKNPLAAGTESRVGMIDAVTMPFDVALGYALIKAYGF